MSGFDGNLHQVVYNPSPGPVPTYKLVTTATQVLQFAPSKPAQIVRWGFLCKTTVNDATNALVLSGDVWPVIGSNSNAIAGSTTVVSSTTGYNAAGSPALYSDTAGGSLTLTASATQVVAGKGVYHTMNPQKASSGSYYPVPGSTQPADTQLVIYPGQQFVISVAATAPSAGDGIFFVEYKDLPFQGLQYNAAGVAITNQAAALSPSNATSNLTQYFQ